MTNDDFPRHKGELALTHNQHKSMYQPIADYIANLDIEWANVEQRGKAIENDSIWEIQWYPDTPIGSISYAACDLDVLLAHVKDIQ